MLILTTKIGNRICIGAGDEMVKVSVYGLKQLDGELQIDLAFEAPDHIPIDRQNVRDAKENRIQEIMDK